MKSILDFQIKKQAKQKIAMVTCYDYTSARIVSHTNVDCVLVGDSGSMVLCGKINTTQATLADMKFMTQAVANGIKDKLIIADLPFMSYRQSIAITIQSITTLIHAGAQAVKLEGTIGNIDTIRHIVDSGVPVMGHLGLTPQFMYALGGFKVQGKTEEAAAQLIEQAEQLVEAGCFAIVLECIPWKLAQFITEKISIPTIGIGAGADTDGQVLVLQDLLGLTQDLKPKFVKEYCNGFKIFSEAINQFVEDTLTNSFPDKKHAYRENVA